MSDDLTRTNTPQSWKSDHWRGVQEGATVTGVHRSVGKGWGGWAGLATGILTLGGLNLIALTGPVPAQAQQTGGICDRTIEVVERIRYLMLSERIFPGSQPPACGVITENHLAEITGSLIYDRTFTVNLSSLQENDFAGLTSLTELELSADSLSSLPANIFNDLTSLEKLTLSSNSLSSLPANIFDGLTSLMELDLSGISLANLPANIFDGLTSLMELDLSGISLANLPANIFNDLTGLTQLNLDNNSLSSLNEDIFDGLTSLTRLNLNNNSLASLPADIFDGLTSLTRLDLDDNSLSSLHEDIFDSLTSLNALYLRRNSLSSLPDDIFSGLTALGTGFGGFLRLQHNDLTCLPRSLFSERLATNTALIDVDNLPDCFGLSLSVTPTEVAEGSVESFTVTATLTPGARVRFVAGTANLEATTVTISVEEDGTAIQGTDFAPVSDFAITIPGGSESATGTFSLTAMVDNEMEVDETVLVSGRSMPDRSRHLAEASTTVTIKDGPEVVVRPTSLNPDEGGAATYTVTLTQQPDGPVTITSTNGDSGAVGVSPASLTFTTSNWDTPQTVTVTAPEDENDIDETVTVSHSVSGYGGLTTADVVTVSVADNEIFRFNASPTTFTVRETASDFYTIWLNQLPENDVTLDVDLGRGGNLGDSSDMSLTPESLTFTASNWTTAQTVTMTALDDDDATDEEILIVHRARGVGGVPDAPPELTVSVMDDDTPGVSVESTSVRANEGGAATYTLVLDTLPDRNVTITPTGDDSGAVSVTPASVTFTTSDWNTAQTVTVTGVEDDDASDESVAISHRVRGYRSVPSAETVTVSVTDDDTSRVSASPASLSRVEGEMATYTLVLDTLPDGAVTVTPSSGDSGAVSVSPASLTFTTSDWNTAQTVTVTALEDANANDERVTISHSVSGYGSLSVGDDVTINVVDNEVAGVSVRPTSLSRVEGEMTTYTLVLIRQPASNVTITPTSDDSGAVSVSPASLTFTTSNWDTVRTVSVTALPDVDFDDETATISHNVSGYGAVTDADSVTISVEDNTPGVRLQPTSVSTEEGGTATTTYTVTLINPPAGNVTLTPASGDTGALNVSPANLTFTPSNWDTAQTVSVTAVRDDDSMDETVTISHSVSGYGALTAAAAVTVTVDDNQVPGVSVETTSLTPEEGQTLTYTLVLNTNPTSSVTITPTSADTGAVSVSPASLTFTASDWSTPKTVTVTAVDNETVTEDGVTISHSVSGYGAVTAADAVTVSVTDNDVPGVSVLLRTAPPIVQEHPGALNAHVDYTLVLDTQPTGPVTIIPINSDTSAVSISPASLTFTTSDWNSRRTVRLTGKPDGNSTDETVIISHGVSGYGAVTSAAAVTVTVDDDDVDAFDIATTDTTMTDGDQPITLTVDEGGASKLYTVSVPNNVFSHSFTLEGDPLSDTVTIIPISDDTSAVSVSPASFTFSMGSTVQTVTVTALEDENDIGETVTINHSISGYGTLTSLVAVTVSVEDNDTVPTVEIMGVPATSAAPFTATIMFSEAVSGFTVEDIMVSSNAMLSAFAPVTTEETAPDTTWTVLVTPTEDGLVTLDIAAGAARSAAGSRGNTVAQQASSAYTTPDAADTTAPTVISITRQDPTTSPTNADSLTWRVTFSEPVLNVDMANFAASGDSTATVTNVNLVSGETLAYDVTVSGGDLADLNGTVTLNFAPDQNIQDGNENLLDTTTLTGTNDNSYTLDNMAPTAPAYTEPTSLMVGTAIMEVRPTTTDTDIASYSATGLPGGLVIDATTGVISGTPTTENTSTSMATVTVTDRAGNSSAPVTLTFPVVDPDTTPPTVTYTAPTSLAVGTAITEIRPTTTDTDIASYSAAGLPPGLVIDEMSGDISGTPTTENTSTSMATVTVTDRAGNSSAPVTLTFPVVDPDTTPPTVTYTAPTSLTVGTAITEISPTTTDTDIASYDADGLPPGLVIDGMSGDISGTPTTENASTSMATVTVTDRAGNSSAPVTLVFPAVAAEDDTTPPMVAIMGLPATSDETGLIPVEEGNMFTYTLKLDTQPSGPVTITPASGDSGAVSVSPASLTFTTTDWNTAQTVSVTGVEDPDTNHETVTISHSVSGYGTVTDAPAVTVRVTDDDMGGDPAGGSNGQTENGSNGQTENGPPAQMPDPNEPMNGSGEQPGSDDPMMPGTDDPTTTNPTVTLSRSSQAVNEEGGGLAFTLTLDEAAASDLTVGLAISETGDMVAATDEGLRTVMVAQGRTRATFTVATEDDHVDEADSTVSVTLLADTAAPATYQVGSAAAATVTVTDNDTAGVSVSTATLTVDEGSSGGYTLALDSQPAGPVTITPASGDSGAVSLSPASLTFTPSDWNTARTVSVTGVDDADTDDETVTISHGVSGYGTVTVADAVTVTVTDDDEDITQDDAEDGITKAQREAKTVLDEVVVPEVVQQLTAQTTEVITSRLNSIASGSLGAPVTLSLDDVLADTVAFFHGERDQLKNGSLEWQQALAGRNFAFPLSGLSLAQGEEGVMSSENLFSSLAVWGGADYSSYGNTIKDTDVDGNGFSGVIGIDLQPIPRLVTGLALTTTRWGLDYTTNTDGTLAEGTYEIGLTALSPYVNWLATEQLSLWATFGYGRGEVEQTPDGDADADTRTDSFTNLAGGVRFEVVPGADPLTGEGAPFALAFKVDAAASSFLDVDARLARLAAEISRSFPVETGLLTAALDLGWSLRSVSGNDDVDGGGAELAGRLNWRNTEGSMSATVDTRVLLGGGDRREWGMGGHLRFTPSRRAGEGLSLTLQPSFGVTGTRLDELWSLSSDGDPAIGNDLPGGRLDAELAYGFPLGNALLTPYTEVAWEEATSTYGAGLRYGLNASLELDLKGAHRSGANGNPENRFSLDVRADL